MKKTMMVSVGLLTMMLASVSWAAPIVSDPFLLSARDIQWTNDVAWGVLSQGDGKLNANHTTTTGDRRAGYKSATGCVLSGDFDIQINFDASSSAIAAEGDAVYGRFLIASVSDATKNIDIRNRRKYNYIDGTWLMLALINNDHASMPENLRGYPAVAFRAVRTGNTLYAYGRPMQQGPNGLLAPVGDGAWTLIQSLTNCFTGDATVSFVTHATGTGTITSTWQDFKIAHSALVSDDFQSSTMDDQWTIESIFATLYQGYGRVYAGHTTTTGDRRAGYKSTTDYVLSGDFDVRINFDAYSSAIAATGDVVYGRFLISSIRGGSRNIDIRNSLKYGYLGSNWYTFALINDGNTSIPENLRGYSKVAFRAVRIGSTLYAYGRPMQQAPNGLLAPVGDGAWTLIQSVPNCFTEEATVSFVTHAVGNGTIASTWQDFELFVESTAAPMPDFSPAYSVISGPKSITITSSLPNAVIRYTDDESEPTEVNGTEIESGDTVSITTSGTTLKARVWADGLDPSPVRSVTYTFPTSYNRPEVIARDDTIVVDGDLSDWSAADFIPLDTPYDGDGASDVINAYYAAKWNSTGKIYVAVKVTDSSQYLVDECEGWDKSDTVEVYLHTQGTDEEYADSWENAQQYVTGLRTDGSSVWTTLAASTSAAPAVAGIVAAGARSGSAYTYEYELTPYDYFGGWFGGTSIVSTLSENDVIGLDVCVSSTDSSGTFLGMTSENALPDKHKYVSSIAIHRLGPEVTYISGDANFDNKVDVGDLGILAANYGMTSWATWSKGDFNGDSKVDVGDLGILAANYGTGTSGANFEADYAKVFGTATDEDEVIDTSLCGGLGLPLVAGLLLMGLMLVKLEQ